MTNKPQALDEQMIELCPFSIGDEVAVIPGCDEWAGDWINVRLWIAAIHALPGGGFDCWVCDMWPLPDAAVVTDGFYMGRKDKPDTLSLVSARAAHSLIAAKVAELEDLPRLIELQRTAAPDCAGDEGWNAALDRAAEMARAALAPHPEGTDQ